MKKECVLVIANRYCDSLKSEILLLPDTVKNLKSLKIGESPGFRLHNLACKPEMLCKYFCAQLEALGYSAQVVKIRQIGEQARLLQMTFETFIHAERDDEWDFLIEELEMFKKYCESVMPILFFI